MKRYINIIILIATLFMCSCRAIMDQKVKQEGRWINVNININFGDKVLNADKKTDLEGELDVSP